MLSPPIAVSAIPARWPQLGALTVRRPWFQRPQPFARSAFVYRAFESLTGGRRSIYESNRARIGSGTKRNHECGGFVSAQRVKRQRPLNPIGFLYPRPLPRPRAAVPHPFALRVLCTDLLCGRGDREVRYGKSAQHRARRNDPQCPSRAPAGRSRGPYDNQSWAIANSGDCICHGELKSEWRLPREIGSWAMSEHSRSRDGRP
ncbi:hypothetical protein ACVMB1_000590 [Bradyrhizobium sp. USDA 4504]